MQNNLKILTPNQCRAARELLNWSQEKLSQKTEISQSTISIFETATQSKLLEFKIGTINNLAKTFEEFGIEFINEEERVGVLLVG